MKGGDQGWGDLGEHLGLVLLTMTHNVHSAFLDSIMLRGLNSQARGDGMYRCV